MNTTARSLSAWCILVAMAFGFFCTMTYLINVYVADSLNLPLVDVWVPYQSFVWSLQYFNYDPLTFQIALLGVFVAMVASMLLSRSMLWIFFRRSRPIPDLHGSAHWSTRKELESTGLLHGAGVYVGAWVDRRWFGRKKTHYLRHDGPEHVLAFAPTRSGKGVGLVLPTLLSWQASVLVYDPKGEAWAITSGWRQKGAGNLVLKFQPESSSDGLATFNPLEEIVPGSDSEVGDAQNMAAIIVDPHGKGADDHWSKTAQALITGAILHCLYAVPQEQGRPANLHDVGELFSIKDMELSDIMKMMLNFPHLADGTAHNVVASECQNMLNRDVREASSVLSTAISHLALYKDPVVAKNTARSSFQIKDLMNHEKPLSLYLVVSPNSADRLRPLMRLMITQIVRRLTGEMQFENGRTKAHFRHRLLLMLDEFATLKKLPVIEEGLSIFAGYGIKAFLVVQDLNQLWGSYGQNEQLIGNCHVRIAFATIKLETAELISKMCGQRTVITRKVSMSGNRSSLALSNVSESHQEDRQSLIRPEDVLRLKSPTKDEKTNLIKAAGELLVFIAGQSPIKGTQILFFQDPVFLKRSQVPAPSGSNVVRAETLMENPSE